MPELLTSQVRIGISACLYGCAVRYNGKAFDVLDDMGRERSGFVFTPVCPEVMAGLGVRRAPIHLTGSGEEVLTGEARVKQKGVGDRTEEVIRGARVCIDALERAGVEAVIVKEGSPSCGVYRAKIGSRRNRQEGAGVFGAMLGQRDWFLIPDNAFDSPVKWWDWRRRLHAWLWLRRRDLSSARDLYETWHVLKFVVQELDRKVADEIGHRIAERKGRLTQEEAEEFRREVDDILRRPSTLPKIRQAMWKTYSALRKSGRLEGVDLHDLRVNSPEVRRNQQRIAEELLGLERISYENDLLFGTSPVIARNGPYRSREDRRREQADRRREQADRRERRSKGPAVR